MGGPIASIVRGVEICLDLKSICCIFDIAPIRLRVYKSKIWPIMVRFEPRETIKRFVDFQMPMGWANP